MTTYTARESRVMGALSREWHTKCAHVALCMAGRSMHAARVTLRDLRKRGVVVYKHGLGWRRV